MLGVLADVAKETRLQAGVRQIDVATRAKVSHTTISRFERGLQPERLSEIVAAYEAECGLGEFELWERTLNRARD